MRRYRAKKKKYSAQRMTRSVAPKPSTKDPAVRQRRCRTNSREVGDATLEKDGWQVFRKQWQPKEAKSVASSMRRICNRYKGSRDHRLRFDKRRLAIPVAEFPPRVGKAAIEMTNSLFKAQELSGKIVKRNIVGIVSWTGSRRQDDHVDTQDRTAFSVLHIMSQRELCIGRTKITLDARDVVVMKGGVCHAGAEHTYKNSSMLIHVPVGYDEQFTAVCSK